MSTKQLKQSDPNISDIVIVASPSMQVQVLNRNREIKLSDQQYGAGPFREETALGEEMQ